MITKDKMIEFDVSVIDFLLFDFDGTLYDKIKEHNPGKGSVEDAHEFFILNAWHMISGGMDPEETAVYLEAEYKRRVEDNTVNEGIRQVPDDVVEHYKCLVNKAGANSIVFVEEFGLHQTFLQGMFKNINFKEILGSDQRLCDVMKVLRTRYTLGMLTTDVFGTVKTATEVLGLDYRDFVFVEDEYGILCSENTAMTKPYPDSFLKAAKIWGVDDSRKIAYIGDKFRKDVEAPLKCGLQAIHVLNEGNDNICFKTAEINEESFQYAQIGSIYALEELL